MYDYSLDDLKMVFTYDLARAVVMADEKVTLEEAAFLQMIVPPEMMRAAGFFDHEDRTTAKYKRAFQRSLEVLPVELDLEQKLQLVKLCFEASLADGVLDDREAPVFRLSASLLGVPDEVFDAFLESHPAVASLDEDLLEYDETVPQPQGPTIVPGRVSVGDLYEED